MAVHGARVLTVLGLALLAGADLIARETPATPPLRTRAGLTPPALVHQIKVLPDQAPDCSSLRSIAESVTRGCRSNDERAIAVYNFMQLTHYHRQYPGEPGGLPVLKEIHCYGWSLCGGLHAEQSAIWRELGWDWRFVGWNGHTTVEARYDDRWHYLDVFLKFYAWMPDGRGGRTIAGEDDLDSDSQGLIRDAFVLDEERRCVYAKSHPFVLSEGKATWRAPEFLACGDTIDDVIGGLRTHRGRDRSEGWAGIVHASGDYSAEVHLAPGFCLENTWDPVPDAWCWAGQTVAPAHTCGGHKDTRNDPGFGLVLEPYIDSKPFRSYANGKLTFAPSFSSDTLLSSFAGSENVQHLDGSLVPAEAGKPASLLISLASPYILTRARGFAPGADRAEVSVDGGMTFQPVDLGDFSAAVKGRVSALVKVIFSRPLAALEVEAVVQNNPGALPYLSPGKNLVTVSVADPRALGENQLVVTYAYRLGARESSFERLFEEGKEVAKQHDARWSETVTFARRAFSASDLPATFEIHCPTPGGRYPVYPRMVMLRREVVAPGSAPSPPPAGAVEARTSPDEELLTLPNPFLVGAEPPPAIRPRPVTTRKIPLTYLQHVREDGAVSQEGTLRWPKNSGERGNVLAGAVIVTGELQDLPARDLAAARLLVPVTRAHNEASGKLGVVFLQQPVRPGQPCDVTALADTAATTLLPRQPAETPDYEPAKYFTLDVTRPVRRLAAGATRFAGLALRMVPDRGVDDGWTVRCDISRADPIYIEVDVYAD